MFNFQNYLTDVDGIQYWESTQKILLGECSFGSYQSNISITLHEPKTELTSFLRNDSYEKSVHEKVAVFCVVVPCSLVEVHRRFGGACCLHHQGGVPDDGGSKYL
jgi:hypothetical protein